MACYYKCDQCGKKEDAVRTKQKYARPTNWILSLHPEKEIPVELCSKECLKSMRDVDDVPFLFY